MNPRTLRYSVKKPPTYKSFPEAYYAELKKLTDDSKNSNIPRNMLENRAGVSAVRIMQSDSAHIIEKTVEVVSTREETAKRIEIEESNDFICWVA